MNWLLSLVLLVGVLFLPGPLWAQVQPKAPEAGEVKVTTTPANLVGDVNNALGQQGVQEVQVRGLALDPNSPNPFLATSGNPLTQLNVGPGQKVDIRTTDGQRFRAQNENGQLRFRVIDAKLGMMDPQTLAAAFPKGSRVEIRGVNAAGQRVRFEMRGNVVKNEVEADHKGKGREGTSRDINDDHAKDQGKDLDHGIRGRDRAEQEHERIEMEREARKDRDRIERQDKLERMDKMERSDRFERSGHDSR